ncbi:MAG: SDR family oxidoreductase [Sulfuritalea sp.]|nr:SDR family oxidoreductase [Sulfuritalea sp.]
MKKVFARFQLDGRRALVTGASGGLGRHFAKTLALAGAIVAVAARRDSQLLETVAEIEQAGGRAYAVALDVTNPTSVTNCFDVIEMFGVPDIIVNNAGVALTAKLLEHTEADWDTVLETNLKGAWRVAREGAQRMISANVPGAIVNVASILGERVAGGVAPYCASKAGLIHLTRAMALELAKDGIRVNALAPGYVETELNRDFLASDAGEKLRSRVPQRRFGCAEDLDGPLLLLASDAGAFMTGAVLCADGGHLVSSL